MKLSGSGLIASAILTILTVLVACSPALGQQRITDYQSICYCSGNGPNSILHYDNNWELALALRNGLTARELDSLGIAHTQSQLRLLSLFQVLRVANDRYYTNIPILDTTATRQVRERSAQIAREMLPFIQGDIASFVAYLKLVGYGDNQFSILFSYVLDGIVWTQLENRKLVNPLHPYGADRFWAGEYWLVTPRRVETFGTDTESEGTLTIEITSGPYRLMKGIYDERQGLLHGMLRNYLDSGRVTDSKVIAALRAYHVFDSTGKLTIPVIVEDPGDRLFVLARGIADSICVQIVSSGAAETMTAQLKLRDSRQAMVVLYHEVMWELLALIRDKKLIEDPLIVSDPAKAAPKDAASLIFLVRGK